MRAIERLAFAGTLLFALAGPVLADPFLWLEERNGEKALAWVAEQNATHGGRVALRSAL